MANIAFNNKNYSIDDSFLSTASTALRSHLSTVMNGSGAVINFGGTSYNVDSAKLLTATNDFISHLRTISGDGYKVVVGGIEYSISSDKVQNAISELHTYLGDLRPAPDSIEDLENKFKFAYFSTLGNAIDAINNGAIDNYNADKETAAAGVYTDETGGIHAVLLKDEVLAARIQPAVDMTLNLGGHKLSSSDILCINVKSGNFTIDGRLSGSGIIHSGTAGTIGCVQVPASSTSNSLDIIGGTYTVNNTNSGNAVALNLKSKSCVTTVKDCTIIASTTNKTANGCVNDGIATFIDCDISSYSNYNLSDGNYTAVSYGVWNTGTLMMVDSNACGTHSGVGTTGVIDIIGGTFEGFGHGGMYVGSEGATAKVRNAILKDSVTMPEGYTNTAPHNGAGMYIGGANNMKVYMDNCDIYGNASQIVLRGSNGEQNNSLYISNSNIYDIDGNNISIRIDNDTHKLYSGTGNNFTADDTTMPTAVIETGETYIMN